MYDEESDTTVPVSVDDDSLNLQEQDFEFFFDGKVRKVWHKQEEEWYFSIVDVCDVLTDSTDPTHYWRVLKGRLKEEGFQTVSNCDGLENETVSICTRFKMKAADGKMRFTDAANTEQLLRIIQSIPSKKAEPFKQWLAKVGAERLEEMADPSLAIERAINTYRQKGYSEKWIDERMKGIDIRKQLTGEWDRAGVKESHQYAALTDTMTKAWSGKTTKEYKQYKGLHKESLRDNMTAIELTLNTLAELSTIEIARATNPQGFQESKQVAHDGGSIAGNARQELEKRIGESVISPLNASSPALLDNRKQPKE